jgi:dTDP-4-amino-4,6-dideoxygalactose transaminase
MGVPFFDLTRQYDSIAEEVQASMAEVIASQRFIHGPQVAELEAALASRFDFGRAVGVASGTDALLLPLRALDAQPGDEVIVPSFTFFATAGAVSNAGLKPVFCDVDPVTFNMTPESVEAAWSERTRAVVLVHLFGQMARTPEVIELARSRGAIVIEDVAQSLGATQLVDGVERQAGSLGDVGAFSFFPTKNLGGFGDGGFISAQNEELGERVSLLRVHGGSQEYHHEFVGTNSRLDTLQAAVLLAKLPHMDRWIERRRENAAAYRARLSGVDGVVLPIEARGNSHTYNQFTLRVARRDELRSYFAELEIGSGFYYPLPLHLQNCFAGLGYRAGDLPNAETLCDEVISLPIFPELREDEIAQVCDAVRGFYER